MANSQKIGVVSDNACALPKKITDQYQIEIVETKLFFPEWEKFPEKNLYQLMAETKSYPKTASPAPGEFLKTYKKVLEKFEKALVITLSVKLSGTFNSAFQAKELMTESEKVLLFDSMSAVAPEGLLVLKAVNLIREGKKIEEVLRELEKTRKKIKLAGFLATTYWAEKSGRMSKFQANLLNFLKGLGIQLIIGVKRGKVGLTGFKFWTKSSLKVIFEKIKKENKKSAGRLKVGINYTDNIDLAYQLKEKLEKELKAEVLFISLVPPIIGANSGPGTLIAGYYYD